MALFAKQFAAVSAFIEALGAQVITLRSGGQIKSENYEGGKSGFLIEANGDAEFNNAVFRGRIEADSGHFIGDLVSGVLFSSNQETGETLPSKTFYSYDTAKTVWDYYGGYAQNIPVNSGSWAGSSGVYGLVLSRDTIPTGGPGLGGTTFRYILDILLFDNSTARRTWASSTGGTLGANLVIDGGRRGPVFRLNLPTGSAGLSTGDIYRDSAGFIKVKL